MTRPMTTKDALDIAAAKERPNITPDERERIITLLRTEPLPVVKAKTRRSYTTLLRIAEAVL